MTFADVVYILLSMHGNIPLKFLELIKLYYKLHKILVDLTELYALNADTLPIEAVDNKESIEDGLKTMKIKIEQIDLCFRNLMKIDWNPRDKEIEEDV